MKIPLMSSKSGGKAPHCKVCGDESSGFHYGVDSCEGCKGFFRRCITQGMNHKCANDEKCEITPFTRNSCQYCRLKKCFEVGMAREASRLGRRPKRLKEVGGEGSGRHTGNLPIAPYPSPGGGELKQVRVGVGDLHKALQVNGSLKGEFMQAYLQAAKASFQEHSKTGGSVEGKSQTGQRNKQQTNTSHMPVPTSTAPPPAPHTSGAQPPGDGAAMGAGSTLQGMDSPPSPEESSQFDLSALDNFLFDQVPTPGSGQQGELSNLSSPFNLGSVTLDPVSNATSPLSDMGLASPLPTPASSALTNGGAPGGSDFLGSPGSNMLMCTSPMGTVANANSLGEGLNMNNNLSFGEGSSVGLNMNSFGEGSSGGGLNLNPNLAFSDGGGGMNVDSHLLNPCMNSGAASTSSALPVSLQQYQLLQQQQQRQTPGTSYGSHMSQVKSEPRVKTEPGASSFTCWSPCSVKTEPLSPAPPTPQGALQSPAPPTPHGPLQSPPPPTPFDPLQSPAPPTPLALTDASLMVEADVPGIMERVKEVPCDERKLLIESVTDKVVEAHMMTTINTSQLIEEARLKIDAQEARESNLLEDMRGLKLEASNMWKMFMSCMGPEIKKLVKFCKRLPGFVELDQEDQIRLIKQGSFEVMLARFALLVDHQEQTMLDPSLTMRVHRSVIREMPMGNFLDEFFFVSSQFNPLKLTDGEVGLFTAILLICPYRKSLSNVRAISKIQALFQQALFFLMKHNHPDPDHRFSRLMSLIPTFHRINEEHFNALSNIRMKDQGKELGFPELHNEIYDGSI